MRSRLQLPSLPTVISATTLFLACFLLLLAAASVDGQQEDCDCSGCGDSNNVYFGRREYIVSPTPCPEGSVATINGLRSIDDNNGGYKVITSNVDSSIFDDSYVYRQASVLNENVDCYTADPSVLPVVGDQPEIQVALDCEAFTRCEFRWDVQFGCHETGVIHPGHGGYQVLSDVDDTITCSNPSGTCDSVAGCTIEGTVREFLAGVDRRLDGHEMYPGSAELMLGLALGADDGGNGNYVPAKPILLSARPRQAEFFLAIDQDSGVNAYLESVGQRNNRTAWGANVDSSLYGTLFDGIDYTDIGRTKAQGYNTLSENNPLTRFVFLGDNGQGDVCAAQSMLESPAGDRLFAVLIHDVQEDPAGLTTDCASPAGASIGGMTNPFDNTGGFTVDLPEGEKVHYFRTHSDAALWCLEKGLISCRSATVVHDAVNEWHACRCLGSGGTCPAGGLPTGVTTPATRDETLAYCAEVESDQGILGAAVEACAATTIGDENAPGGVVVPAEPTGPQDWDPLEQQPEEEPNLASDLGEALGTALEEVLEPYDPEPSDSEESTAAPGSDPGSSTNEVVSPSEASRQTAPASAINNPTSSSSSRRFSAAVGCSVLAIVAFWVV